MRGDTMKQLQRSLLTILLAAGTSFICFAQTEQQTPIQVQVQEHTLKIGNLVLKSNELIRNNPREALTMFEEVLLAEAPVFNSENPNMVIASFNLYSNLARLYFESARAADSAGYWEKAAEYHKKSVEVIDGAAVKTKESFTKFSENYESWHAQIQSLLDANIDEINKLKAKDEKDYTNEDWESKEKLVKWENDLKEVQEAIDYYKKYIEDAENRAAWYRTPSREELMLEKIKEQQAEIDGYRGGPGDAAKWVEGVVASYATYMQNYSSVEDRISMTYRLMVLSPESKTAPVLLNVLEGRATEADLKRATQAARRPAARGR